MNVIRVKIPATSANLGAGFDCLGLAVNMYNYVDMELSDTIKIASADAMSVPPGRLNLVFSSAEYLFKRAGKRLDGLNIIQTNNIPMTRGLGSSSACIIGGLVGANYLLGNIFSQEDLINYSALIEGHPDNTTPSIVGGIVTAASENKKVYWAKQDVDCDVSLVAIIPDFKLSTALARNCLPTEISHDDARFNLSRCALFFASFLQKKYENIRVAVDDKLHQPYRMKLIPSCQEVFNAAYDFDALGVFISGAGPTIMNIIRSDNVSFISRMRVQLDNLGLNGWDIINLSVDNVGATVYTLG